MILNPKGEISTIESVLERIEDSDIYQKYMPHEFAFDKACISPFRNERNPSFLIGTKSGRCYHVDYSNPLYKGDCFDFVQQMFGISLAEAIQKIINDFEISPDTKVIKKIEKPERREPTYRQIQVIAKQFTSAELRYWNSYHIDISELKAEEVYSVGKVYLDKKKIPVPDEMVFGYLYENKHWKIYQPLKEGYGKWMSSVPLTVVDGLTDIKNVDKCLVTKSKKDKIVIKKFVPCCSVQNESLFSFSDNTINHLKANSKSVYIAFDSDEPGVKASIEVTKKFDFKHINVPLSEGVKDFAEWAKQKGLDEIGRFIYSRINAE